MSLARSAFILAAVPYTLLALLWLFFDKAAGNSGFGKVSLFTLCGGMFVYGSILALRGGLPLSSLMLVGAVLNMLGAVVWMPALRLGFEGGVGLAGLLLAGVWAAAIYSAYREQRR